MIQRLLQQYAFRVAVILLLIGLPAVVPFADASSGVQKAEPVFDVATIRRSDSGAPMLQKLNEDGRYFSARNASLTDLIQFAYDVQATQIIDPSGQAGNDRYDISAVCNMDGTPSVQQVKFMLRKLLTDRYQLVFHSDKRMLSAFVLAKGKNASKLVPTQWSGSVPKNDMQPVVNGWTLSMRNASTTDFTRFLQMIVLDRPVVDSTGMVGQFDISVTFTPEEWQFNGHGPPARHADNGDTAPGLFGAIKEQLGLQMESRKTLVDVMVIDHVEKPSPN